MITNNPYVISSKNLLSIDIQLDYEKYLNFDVYNYCSFLNESNYNNIFFIFNGEDMGYANEGEQKFWLVENGLEEEKLDAIIFIDKNYCFFRDMMDEYDYTFNEMVEIINRVKNSQGYDEELNIYYPFELHNALDSYDNFDMIGGGRYECLLEMELLLTSMNKKYDLIERFVY